MRGMRALRNFKPNHCYHLISRIANRAFYLTDEEACAFLEGKRPQDLEEVESRMREAIANCGSMGSGSMGSDPTARKC